MRTTKQKLFRYTVVFEPEEGGGFHVYCPALPGCHTYARTKAAALKNIKEAMRVYLGSLKKMGSLTQKMLLKRLRLLREPSPSCDREGDHLSFRKNWLQQTPPSRQPRRFQKR